MKRKPNILYILADDQGYGDVSCLNPESKIPTPFTDKLAKEGMVFTDAHSNSSVCTPTRYGVLTGRYCWRSSLKSGVLWGYSPLLIEEGRETVASFLRRHGYYTACIGKWHLGLDWALKPGYQEPTRDSVDFSKPVSGGPHTVGFDYSFIIPASLDMEPYCYVENGRVVEEPTEWIQGSPRPAFWREGRCAPGFVHETCLLEFLNRAESFLTYHAHHRPNMPFFLYFPTPSPHTPHFSRTPFKNKSQAGTYGDYVVEHDWVIGRLVHTLERLNLRENTLIIVTSDNGCHMTPIGLWEKYGHRGNFIYRGEKSDAWDGGHRIPFIVSWPGVIPKDTRCNQVICLTDLFATVAAIIGEKPGEDMAEDSCNILPYFLGDFSRSLREAIVHHSIDGYFAIRQGPWKLILCRGSGGWSLPEKSVPLDAPPMQLYHMENNQDEQNNLYNQYPEIAEKLQNLLRRYQEEGRSIPYS